MNRVMLIGRLTAKPELRYTGSNIPYARFSIAVNRPFNSQDGNREADFINIIAWRKQAETICNYFDKGNQIAIEGRLQTGSYDDKDGKKVYVTEVIAEEAHFADSKRADGANTFDSGFNVPTQASNIPSTDGFTAIEDDSNLPF